MQAFVRCAPRRWLELSVGVLPLLSAFTACPLQAQGQSRGRGDVQAALTVEGGGTLGSYEGGLTWALVEIFRQRREAGRGVKCPTDTLSAHATGIGIVKCLPLIELRAAAGASAGSINAFIAANRWCSMYAPQREDSSSFWRVWIPTGLSDLLLRRKDANWETGLFARKPFNSIFFSLDSAWKKSEYLPDCNLTFGAAITRLSEDSLPISIPAKLFARNQRFAAAFTVSSKRQPDSSLTYTQPPPLDTSRIRLGALVHLPLDSGGKIIPHRFSHDLIKASSGYPLAFAPYPMSYCRDSVGAVATAPPGLRCPSQSEFRTSYFVDGGVFDNGPLTITYALALADPSRLSLDSLYMLFVTPSRCRISSRRSCAYGAQPSTVPNTALRPEEKSDGLDAVSKLLGAFIPSARQYELQIASRFLPTIQAIDRREDQKVVEIDNIKHEKDEQERRASRQYDSFATAWRSARTDVGYLTYVIDSLRNVLAQCRQRLSSCDDLAADSAERKRPNLLQWLEPVPGQVAADPIVARQRATRRPFDSVLIVSNRWHPLAGDWLFGFGGLIGRPLREYDFFVGVYDALALISQRILCEASDTACVRRHLARLIASPPLHLSSRGRLGLSVLYSQEFGHDTAFRMMAEPMRSSDSVVAYVLTAREDSLTSADDSVLVAIIRAMGRMGARPRQRKPCRGDPIQRTMCSDGMDFAFEKLRDTPGFMRTIRAQPDKRFAAFVSQPDVQLNWLTGQLLEQIAAATPHDSGLKPPLAVVSAMYYATNERGRTGFDGGSVSLPAMSGAWPLVIPSSMGGFLGIPGWYAEWAGRWHKNAGLALGGTTRVVWRSGMKRQFTGQRGSYVVPSLRADWKTPFAPLVSVASLDVAYWIDTDSREPRSWDNRQLSPGISLALFAQKVRISVAKRPAEYVIRKKDKPLGFVSLGIGDFNGILYWLSRML